MYCDHISTKKVIVSFLVILAFLVSTTIVLAGEDEPDFLNDEFYENGLESEEYILDRLEPLNRAMFVFNDKMYIWVLEPVATAYSKVVPTDLRICVYNFFRNLEEPVRFVNTVLQGRFDDAGHLLCRFFINSTLGVFGLGDVAERIFGQYPVEATLGETLSKWGVGDGSYIVVPFYGPSTLRDFTGTVIDGLALTPYYSWTDENSIIVATYAGKDINKISLHLGEYEELKQVFFDPYVGFRNAYFQYRRQLRDHRFEDDSGKDKQ